MKHIFRGLQFVLIALLLTSSLFLVWSKTASASCDPEEDHGGVETTVDITTEGTYRVWSRVQNPSGKNSSYMLEIDGNCINVDGLEHSADTWTWVDYQDGNIATKTNVDLSVGSHTVKFIGTDADIQVDRVLFMPDALCVPADQGDSCVEAEVTPGDVNGDSVVNVFDLSTLLFNWSKSDVDKQQGDLNGDGVVNVFDLSTLLINWGTGL